MEISANGAVNAALAQQEQNTQQQVQVSVLKKAIDMQSQAALSLIENLPQVSQPTPVGSLGHNVDTKA